MAEPAFSGQTPEQDAALTNSGSTQAVPGPGLDKRPDPDDVDGLVAGDPLDDSDQNLRLEVSQLRRAMRTRPAIDQAKGVLMAAYSLTPDEAWEVLVTVSQHTNTKLHVVAEGITASTQEGVVDACLRGAIQAALRELGKQ
ncbi:ANTAR domain-containing protein [Streptomyces bathyalis]|uniref:ANTAR domain-containing protein n=1 Tax=Streptomyces bathyalis TaxID=2710756 RepID=A0A7T1T6Y9_9ACTN|nr:ANTAR domain-containing protein [Streptomyces bathyalis]